MELGGAGLGPVRPPPPALACSYDDLAAPVELPPGFRFHPTDEEIIMHYLLNKVMDRSFSARAIGEADFNKCEPWDLPKKAKMGEKEWFFFCQRDRKYPTGTRTNRATESGYWKATGKDKEIYYQRRSNLVGMKKTLVFYKGRAPKGEKTNWVMHEYRLEGNFSNHSFSKEEWVVSRVFHKNIPGLRTNPSSMELARIDSLVEHLLDTNYTLLPPLLNYTNNACSNHLPMADASSTLQNTYQHHQASPSSLSLGYQHQSGFGNPMGLMSPKMEENNSFVSQSQETGLSTENVANNNEITSMHGGDVESMKPFDQELEGLRFSPDMSDMDSLWNY